MAAPIAARRSRGSVPKVSCIRRTVLYTMPAAAPRQPAWAAPTAPTHRVVQQDDTAVGGEHHQGNIRRVRDHGVHAGHSPAPGPQALAGSPPTSPWRMLSSWTCLLSTARRLVRTPTHGTEAAVSSPGRAGPYRRPGLLPGSENPRGRGTDAACRGWKSRGARRGSQRRLLVLISRPFVLMGQKGHGGKPPPLRRGLGSRRSSSYTSCRCRRGRARCGRFS